MDPRKKVLSLAEEFKAFALKGNVVDLAVGVVIGAAFGKIVESLVKNVVMPLLTLVLPTEQSYTKWAIQIGDSRVEYGIFIGEVLNFLIVALALFLFIRVFLGWVMSLRRSEETVAETPPLTRDQELLIEIRDLLRAQGPAVKGPEPGVRSQEP
jgi:large conductance mechanosensitive channel